MKRYFSGILAVVIAIGAMSFEVTKDAQTLYTFEYNAAMIEADIETEANWTFIGTNQQLCPTNVPQQEACRLSVPASEVNTGTNTLLPSADVAATGKKVISVDNGQVSNQPE